MTTCRECKWFDSSEEIDMKTKKLKERFYCEYPSGRDKDVKEMDNIKPCEKFDETTEEVEIAHEPYVELK